MRHLPRVPLLFAVVFAIALGCSRSESPTSLHQFSGPTMGTRYTVKVVAHDLPPQQRREVDLTVRAALDDVNAKMSHYVDDSEVSRLNRWSDPTPIPVSAETFEVLQRAHDVSVATRGAFDVTVGPLVDAWGFGRSGRPLAPPARSQIQRLLALTGWELLELDADSSSVRKLRPELHLDLSAIAKGYGVDRVAEALEAAGLDDYMVEVGGEIRTGGVNHEGQPWRIGIERPVPGERAVELVLSLRDLAVATSGDYRNYWEIDGRRISHTIDPRSGQPIAHNVASVSVVSPLCVLADAYATGLLVLGPEGVDLAEELQLAAYFLQRGKGDVFVGRMTTAFEELIADR